MTETLRTSAHVPAKASLDGLESRWGKAWDEEGTYSFDTETTREAVYSIDTPPPTVSGSLHVGHVFSYTHTDVLARYKRMRGMNVFYPMGWDDNGLPTERRVQNYYGVRCDPSLPYEEGFVPPHDGGDGKSIKYADQKPISRRNFIELCWKLTEDDEKQFEALWRYLGLSVDWKQNYQTIGMKAQKVAQAAFIRNVQRGEAYQAQAPGLWDVTFQTAVAQAELEAREYPGAYHSLQFHTPDGDVTIETTRPELLPACVAIIAHPDDERYQHLFGKTATTPVFGVEVPILPHPMAEIDKGSGIVMCCTFGDLTDVQWWRELGLPMRTVLGKDGRLVRETPGWITTGQGREVFAAMAGATTFTARKVLVEKLAETGEMIGEPKPTTRMTNFFEKGDKPLEIVPSRQWYIRNGGRSYEDANGKELRENLLERGEQLHFHPDFMKVRYNNWVEGLNTDWLISRQRFFGVPLPVWYRVSEAGDVDYDSVLLPTEDMLPVDPSSDTPPGFDESQRGEPGGFVGEVDIMDTWATSSMSPQVAGGWLTDEKLFSQVYPMDLRPQGQDIIRTWLFSTVVRAHLEFGGLPWKHAAISGWILDPDRKKMSKSKGNVVTPMGLLESHGSDAVRYWAASARLGTDAAFDEQQMKIGRRLAMKVLNASKFALGMGGEGTVDLDLSAVIEPLDRAMLAMVSGVVERATAALESYDHTRALELTETCFWTFCDDYLELVKDRAYDRDGAYADAEQANRVRSARVALNLTVDTFLRLLAPVLPYATEEVWSWYREGSVHRASWPTPEALAAEGNPELVGLAGSALAALRKVKSEQKVSQRTAFAAVTLQIPAGTAESVELVRAELVAAAHVKGDLTIIEADVAEPEVTSFEFVA
ncbi:MULTISPECIES: valine--tRNA ligase [Trueperella]|uniref:Valine--tRNA ligase n=1 Tax=Trueperella bernardiae TaxID=59561 RepID=A0A0W1KM60_9ACTO|nr:MULTISPECIES: valine--tRNA ligase [Trueperella]KTF04711.1 Valine--tRNA ligase [Trueperella bernardiae]MCM3907375.1 valine--tRNA ligase [Trueperella bernardiae]MDK8601344.1 valine--tRNA ligase [Trueperella bernardiae]OCW61176.1 valine--tRNA ligase [Trueperella bernardiae]OFS65712.1 valine--tRNA ligase [Trueperella sp. HMSC08H06]